MAYPRRGSATQRRRARQPVGASPSIGSVFSHASSTAPSSPTVARPSYPGSPGSLLPGTLGRLLSSVLSVIACPLPLASDGHVASACEQVAHSVDHAGPRSGDHLRSRG